MKITMSKRLIAIALSILFLASCFPVNVFADDMEAGECTSSESTTVVTTEKKTTTTITTNATHIVTTVATTVAAATTTAVTTKSTDSMSSSAEQMESKIQNDVTTAQTVATKLTEATESVAEDIDDLFDRNEESTKPIDEAFDKPTQMSDDLETGETTTRASENEAGEAKINSESEERTIGEEKMDKSDEPDKNENKTDSINDSILADKEDALAEKESFEAEKKELIVLPKFVLLKNNKSGSDLSGSDLPENYKVKIYFADASEIDGGSVELNGQHISSDYSYDATASQTDLPLKITVNEGYICVISKAKLNGKSIDDITLLAKQSFEKKICNESNITIEFVKVYNVTIKCTDKQTGDGIELSESDLYTFKDNAVKNVKIDDVLHFYLKTSEGRTATVKIDGESVPVLFNEDKELFFEVTGDKNINNIIVNVTFEKMPDLSLCFEDDELIGKKDSKKWFRIKASSILRAENPIDTNRTVYVKANTEIQLLNGDTGYTVKGKWENTKQKQKNGNQKISKKDKLLYCSIGTTTKKGFVVKESKSVYLNFIADSTKPTINCEYSEIYTNSSNHFKWNAEIEDKESGLKSFSWIMYSDSDKKPETPTGVETFNDAVTATDICKKNIEVSETLTDFDGAEEVFLDYVVDDRAGNKTKGTLRIIVDTDKPEININNIENAKHYNEAKLVGLEIKEANFDEDKTVVKVKRKTGYNKNDSEYTAIWSNWSSGEDDNQISQATFSEDGTYTVDVECVDKAGNKSKKSIEFTIDTVAPTGIVTATDMDSKKANQWNSLVDSVSFDLWSKLGYTISISAKDELTENVKIEYYYQDSADSAKSKDELDKVKWSDDRVAVTPNRRTIVYAKLTDTAGNYTYISTNVLVADNKKPMEIEENKDVLKPVIKVTSSNSRGDFYNNDVNLEISVRDPKALGLDIVPLGNEGICSGLNKVTYTISSECLSKSENKTLSLSGDDVEKDSATNKPYKGTWNITINSKDFNSNDVYLKINASDNAGNQEEFSYGPIKIDITKPKITVLYNNNSPANGKYYNRDRVATVVITERNFNENDVRFTIKNTDGVVPSHTKWNFSKGDDKNGDGNKHTATITYHADGDYTFAMEFIDLANNKCNDGDVNYDGTNPKEFTIDQTKPAVTVTYNNNSARNGKYFNKQRIGTVTILEHNFDIGLVKFSQTASIAGKGIRIPAASWRHAGDKHYATFTYNADGDYTFDVTMQDLASNDCGQVNFGSCTAGKAFTVDTAIDKMEITGVSNGKAYTMEDSVIPVIVFSDINYEGYGLKLLYTGADVRNKDVTSEMLNRAIVTGNSGISRNDVFIKTDRALDGIYTLSAMVLDKAGNTKEEKVSFIINRYGSVYTFDNYLNSLLKNRYVQKVSENITLVEYNASAIDGDSIKIDVTRDGRPIDNLYYEINPVVTQRGINSAAQWSQYEYSINKDNFKEDGIYKITISSKDAAGNTPENNNYKDREITFMVDNTAPEITSIIGLEENLYNADSENVKYVVYDSIGIQSVCIYVDGKLIDEIKDFQNDLNNYNDEFSVYEGNHQRVRFVVKDLAGNILDTDEKDENGNELFTPAYTFNKNVTVSTNLLVLWYENKPIFWGSIVVISLLATLFAIIAAKRKKQNQQ